MAVLFGLAMDYEVFMVSRIREAHVHGAAPPEAVLAGSRHASRVVTAAALILFAVFESFIPGGNTMLKPIAFALAVGVCIDAFLVRMTLVPAVLALVGRAGWWLPKWLDRLLPDLDIEGNGSRRIGRKTARTVTARPRPSRSARPRASPHAGCLEP